MAFELVFAFKIWAIRIWLYANPAIAKANSPSCVSNPPPAGDMIVEIVGTHIPQAFTP